MKECIRLFVLAIAVLIGQTALAQEKRNYRDIAFDYLLQNIKSIDARPWKVVADHYDKMPNGDYIVKLTIARTLTRQEQGLVPVQVQAYGATFNVGTKWGTVYTNYEDKESYLIFVDRYGTPTRYVGAPESHEFHYLNGNAWLFANKGRTKYGEDKLYYFYGIVCYKNNGEVLWKAEDMNIYGWANTSDNLYLVGTYQHNALPVVRTINTKTFEYKDKEGVCDGIPYHIDFEGDGLKITEYNSHGHKSSFKFPYAANDKPFQIKLLLKNYDLNKASDQVALGERYLTGDIVDKDEKKAVELFEKAANQNNVIGMLKLAECYRKGSGVAHDDSKALSLYERAGNLGNTDAMMVLSDMYAEGNGTEKNMSNALYWKEQLAFKGDLNAQKVVLANQALDYKKANLSTYTLLENARSSYSSMNYDWAKFCYERLIALGNTEAMYEYGKWLYEGKGIAKDCNKALEYLRKVGEDNNLNAQKLLASIYRDNNGISPDIKQEIYWTAKAADNGDVESQMSLAEAYNSGIGIKKDKKLAFKYCEMAANKGSHDAIIAMVYRYVSGDGVKKDMASALSWFNKMNSEEEQLKIADAFYFGINTKKNMNVAAILYNKLSDGGNMQATKKLAMCYLDGNGVSKDITQAYNLAMKIRNTTHVGDDGDIYYIEGKYQESRGRWMGAIECYNRAERFGNVKAAEARAKLKAKYRIR